MTKKLNEGALHNELAGSLFFQPPTQPEPNPSPTPHRVASSAQTVITRPPAAENGSANPSARPGPADQDRLSPPSARAYARTPVRRTITRYAFEFYQDQIEALRSLALAEKLQGGHGSMSEMVREAIDSYIARLLDRTDEG